MSTATQEELSVNLSGRPDISHAVIPEAGADSPTFVISDGQRAVRLRLRTPFERSGKNRFGEITYSPRRVSADYISQEDREFLLKTAEKKQRLVDIEWPNRHTFHHTDSRGRIAVLLRDHNPDNQSAPAPLRKTVEVQLPEDGDIATVVHNAVQALCNTK